MGIADVIMRDNTGKNTCHNTEFMKLINKYCIAGRTAEPEYPWRNIAENKIVKVIKLSLRILNRQVTKRLLGYGLVYEYQIISIMTGKHSRAPLKKVTGDTPDISEWVDFDLYDLVF